MNRKIRATIGNFLHGITIQTSNTNFYYDVFKPGMNTLNDTISCGSNKVRNCMFKNTKCEDVESIKKFKLAFTTSDGFKHFIDYTQMT